MATANTLATVQSKKQPQDSQFDLETLISVLRTGRVSIALPERQLSYVCERFALCTIYNQQLQNAMMYNNFTIF